ncbi:Anhydro-N-acetylmuramic acid kinase [Niveomyces insectorum RCEF 264]|uniref:Anhydro-N-acetylmuramic acid kinase n=1 Tax=Niveomyces insectorum RCEF 264 TaxID=1081102 RepID=A0A167W612_9HYPO|nr:Anhydro-N-acetylmuramic acid kinase [Niveomyces insectorum RCEF 264]
MVYILGLNSGSSFDGVDAVLCTIELAADGHPARPVYIDGLTVDWPKELQPQILKAFANELTLFEMTRLNYVAGALYAEAANALIKKNGLRPDDIDVIGYDGQTIYQEPPDRQKERDFVLSGSTSLVDKWLRGGYPCGLFIAESGVVAALTDVDTVTQFRPLDHALGGSAAPLMQYLDFVAFRDLKEEAVGDEQVQPVAVNGATYTNGDKSIASKPAFTVTLNIGGIANLQLAHRDRSKMMAFDTGPGNVMIDHVVKARTGRAYDKDGALAARGMVLPTLLAELLSHDFFARTPPRSAWRLDFGADYADRILAKYHDASTEDLLATMTRLTAVAIASSLVAFILPRTTSSPRVIASGGGTRNATLMRDLASELATHGLTLATSDAYGLPAAYKEAIKFATLAFAAKRGLANNIPAAGGATRYAVLGKLSLAPRRAKNAEPVVGRDERVLGLKFADTDTDTH